MLNQFSFTFYRTTTNFVDWMPSAIYPKSWISNGFSIIDMSKVNVNELDKLVDDLGILSKYDRETLYSLVSQCRYKATYTSR